MSKETGEVTVEPVHEALLRQWGLLQGWLTEDLGLLSVLDGVKRASRDWAANRKNAAWHTHSGERLKVAQCLRERSDLSGNLEPTDWDYLTACVRGERAALGRKRSMQAFAAGLVLLLAAGGVGWLNQDYLKDQYYWHFLMVPTSLKAPQESALKAGDTFKECQSGCPEMVVVPSGKFMMGSPASEGGIENEYPQHEVTIPKPFAIGKFEVTFAEWDACVAVGYCPAVPDRGMGRGKRPAINVTWDEAVRYAAWLSRLTGATYRLLTEAEWEYAARAGSTTDYSFGEIGEYAWHGSNADGKSHPVGEKKPNAFGLHDMLGNVWEWVEDPWHYGYDGAPSEGSELYSMKVAICLCVSLEVALLAAT